MRPRHGNTFHITGPVCPTHLCTYEWMFLIILPYVTHGSTQSSSWQWNLFIYFVGGIHWLPLDSHPKDQLHALNALTHWGRVTHICVSKLDSITSDNGLSPGRRQAIIWTNTGILLTGPSETNFSEILIEIHTFSFKKMHFKMSSGKWRPFSLGLNVLSISPLSSSDQNWEGLTGCPCLSMSDYGKNQCRSNRTVILNALNVHDA